MHMIKNIEQLQKHWGFEIPSTFTLNIDDVENCHKQISDELTEIIRDVVDPYTQGASTEDLKKGLLDVSVDLTFFLMQMIVRQGLAQEFDGAFRKILDNNMSKVCKTEEDANKTVQMYLDKGENVRKIYVESEGHWVVLDQNNKVLKPWNFESVEL